MNSTEIEKLINNFFEKLNDKEFETIESYLSPHVVFHFPGTQPLKGSKKVKQLLQIIYRRYPHLKFRVNDIIIQKNRVASIWENAGTDKQGKPYRNEGVTIFTFEQGKVIYMSDYFK
ncbi:MAG: nuclear transport factor 2 family protein, partial [candidate division WOR-3 bacterium]